MRNRARGLTFLCREFSRANKGFAREILELLNVVISLHLSALGSNNFTLVLPSFVVCFWQWYIVKSSMNIIYSYIGGSEFYS